MKRFFVKRPKDTVEVLLCDLEVKLYERTDN